MTAPRGDTEDPLFEATLEGFRTYWEMRPEARLKAVLA